MKDIENIIADLEAWGEEDRESRAIGLVVVEKTEEIENGYNSKQADIAIGKLGFVANAFQNVLRNKDPKNGLQKALKYAIGSEAAKHLTAIGDNSEDREEILPN